MNNMQNNYLYPKKNILFILQFITICFLLSSCSTTTKPSGSLLLDHTLISKNIIDLNGIWLFKTGNFKAHNYYQEKLDVSDWDTINVPANWFLAGHDISGVAWYRKHFDISSSDLNSHMELSFDGVDYTADVWLNGHYLGFHEGYFQQFQFDISGLIRETNNVLVVRVNSPLEQPGTSWSLHKRLIKGIFGHHDTRPGGAWSERGQEKNTGGIWAPVSIKMSDNTVIRKQTITTLINTLTNTSSGYVNVEVEWYGSDKTDAVLDIKLSPNNFEGTSEKITRHVVLSSGMNTWKIKIPAAQRPLWWPWEMGEPHLYDAETSIITKNSKLVRDTQTFGFRSVDVDSETGQWFINGKRLFLRGTNYIPTQWLSNMDTEAYAEDLKLMREANINSVRVHAHILAKDFYHQADRDGILIWQDFPLQWGYVDTEEFIQQCENQAVDMVSQFYNHPSIVVWSGHNEPPWDASWMTYKYSDYDEIQNKNLDDRLFDALKREDKSRYIHKVSSTAEHPWFGWYSGEWQDYAKPTELSLITEFGAQALPDIATLEGIVGKENLWPTEPKQMSVWDYHNFQPKETFELAKIPKGNNTQELIENTQQYQANLIKLAAESYRRQRYQPVNAIFQFMFVENWPSMNWGMIDYKRQPKPGYFALKTAYQPVLPSIEGHKLLFNHGESVEFSLWAINDLHRGFPDVNFRYQLIKDNRVIDQLDYKTNLFTDSGIHIADIKKNDLALGRYQVLATINSKTGTELGRNSYNFSVTNSKPD